jgi:RNase P subunit RPR2
MTVAATTERIYLTDDNECHACGRPLFKGEKATVRTSDGVVWCGIQCQQTEGA